MLLGLHGLAAAVGVWHIRHVLQSIGVCQIIRSRMVCLATCGAHLQLRLRAAAAEDGAVGAGAVLDAAARGRRPSLDHVVPRATAQSLLQAVAHALEAAAARAKRHWLRSWVLASTSVEHDLPTGGTTWCSELHT
jgi:hypothetical protein